LLGHAFKFWWQGVSSIKFEVFTAVTIKNAVFWDVAPCRYCVNRSFGGMYRLHLQGTKIRERGTSVSRWLLPSTKSPLYLWLKPFLSIAKNILANRLVLLINRHSQ
jgi:hypothetical protein